MGRITARPMFSRLARFGVLFAFSALIACNAHESAAPGTERGPCFPNQTCFTGLACLSMLFVVPPDAGAEIEIADAHSPDASESWDPDASADSDATLADASSTNADAAVGDGAQAELDGASSSDASAAMEVEIGTGSMSFVPIA